MGDESEMERLFQNLIGNAVKYHRTDHPPQVLVSCEDRGDLWRIVVSDNGIGVPPEHAERIFGIFQRLHARNEFEGTGVGLAIVKRIVERHGGSIRAEPGEGHGTTMVFTWPKLRDVAEVS
jgi:signal transduction histidine kinase